MKREDLYDEIARLAYELYERNGYAECRDLDHWLEAEMMVLANYADLVLEEPEIIGVIEIEESSVPAKKAHKVTKSAEKHTAAKKAKPKPKTSAKGKK